MNLRLDHQSELRSKLLADHRALRSKMGTIRSLALGVARGDHDLADALRMKCEEFTTSLFEHMRWEEQNLANLLGRSERGLEKVIDLGEDHAVQTDLILSALQELRDDRTSPERVARRCLALIQSVETDMASEERHVLRALEFGSAG